MALTTFIVVSSSFFIPVTLSHPNETTQVVHIRAAVALLHAMLLFSASALFIRAVKGFKEELKPAYKAIAYGMLASGLGFFMLPVADIIGQRDADWVLYILHIPAFISYCVMYYGLRRFAQITEVKTKATSYKVAITSTLLLALIASLLPHSFQTGSEAIYDLTMIARAAAICVAFLGVYIISRIIKNIGKDYHRPFRFLAFAYIAGGLSFILVQIIDIVGHDNVFYQLRAQLILFGISAICFVLSAYYFNTLTLAQKTSKSWWSYLFASRLQYSPTSMDVISYAADMVSDVSAIDKDLDKVRELTAMVGSVDEMTDKDQRTLRGVYSRIEEHLISNDALRHLDKQEIRRAIENEFSISREAPGKTFWNLLS